MNEPRRLIFVFGSNEQGIHGAGAARAAVLKWGAQHGVGHGLCGDSYALPTKRTPGESLPLPEIAEYVGGMMITATWNGDWDFLVTRVGCGLAGYRDEQIAPMFALAPLNCIMPIQWRQWCAAPGRRWHHEDAILPGDEEATP